MPQQTYSVAENLCRLAKDFQSGDPIQANKIKKEFKAQSKNDVVRAVVYLMEVIGSRDEQFKRLQEENTDLKEILKLNDIDLDKGIEELNEGDKTTAQATALGGSTSTVAAEGNNSSVESGGSNVSDSGNTEAAQAN